jgi:hypothetical protein
VGAGERERENGGMVHTVDTIRKKDVGMSSCEVVVVGTTVLAPEHDWLALLLERSIEGGDTHIFHMLILLLHTPLSITQTCKALRDCHSHTPKRGPASRTGGVCLATSVAVRQKCTVHCCIVLYSNYSMSQ